ncbi:hypothetical protein B0J12DRAFT_453742 [Macrophomina phaseolina]|uniref:Uncharacterized protein n=1 Tax=Macrophomina phaseolina TaxID=35725 RepID=A0ABQ8GG55_9PEZI|nr:hypothetical protein B0J12DRAFT_453742 [Macrophomina phaseolina]
MISCGLLSLFYHQIHPSTYPGNSSSSYCLRTLLHMMTTRTGRQSLNHWRRWLRPAWPQGMTLILLGQLMLLLAMLGCFSYGFEHMGLGFPLSMLIWLLWFYLPSYGCRLR